MKKLTVLLVSLCLIVGLFPLTALADTPTAKILIMGSQELTVVKGSTPVYLKNKEFDAYNKADGSTTFKAWTQEPGDAENWNVKFEWPGDSTPTITLKDAKFDYYDNSTQSYVYLKQADGTYASTAPRKTDDDEKKDNLLISAIMPVPGFHYDLKVVLQGENTLEMGNGFILSDAAVKANDTDEANGTYTDTYFQNITITSIDNGSIVANGGSAGILNKDGYDLTFENAYVTLSTTHSGSNATPVHVSNGDITINGGHLTVTNPTNLTICAFDSGNITVNGDITVNHALKSTAEPAGIYAPGGIITVNGGNIIGESSNAPILYGGNGTVINGGYLKLTSGHIAIYAKKDGDVKINGGTIEIMAKRAFNRVPSVADTVTGYAGSSFKNAKPYEPDLCDKPWLKLSDQPMEAPPVNEDPDEIELPTTAPTDPVEGSIQATTPASGDEEAPETTTYNSVVWYLISGVLICAAIGFTIFFNRRKKAQ